MSQGREARSPVTALRRGIEFLGRRGTALVGICVALAPLLATVEYALAFSLVLLLHALHLMSAGSLPAWLARLASRTSAKTVWVTLLAVVIARAIVTIANYGARALLAEGTHARMQMALAYRVLVARDVRPVPLSEMSLYTGEVFPKATEYMLRVAQAAASLVQAALMGVGTFVLAPWPAAVALAGVGVAGFGMHGLNRVTSRIGHRVQAARADLERTKVRIARNRFLIQVIGIQDIEYAAWLRTTLSCFRNNTVAYVLGHLAGALMPAIGLGLVAAIVLLNGPLFHAPAANLVAFFYLFYRAQQLIANAAMHLGGLAWYEPQAIRARELVLSLSPEERRSAMRPESGFRVHRRALDLTGATANASENGPGAASAPRISRRRVHFSWTHAQPPVLRDLSLDVAPGARLAIAGPNGSGKSTLLALLLGAMQPTAGEIAIDGMDCRAWASAHPQAAAYVGPDPYLINGSVRDNLVYGAGQQCAEAEIWDALAAVGLDDVFRMLPARLDYVIEENGDGLSSGQKQRIAIARALLRRPALLVMDEPSANLDAESETRILAALGRLNQRCTVVLVSHSPRMLLGADQVIELADRIEAIA